MNSSRYQDQCSGPNSKKQNSFSCVAADGGWQTGAHSATRSLPCPLEGNRSQFAKGTQQFRISEFNLDLQELQFYVNVTLEIR